MISLPQLTPEAWRLLRHHIAASPPGVLDDVRLTFARFVIDAGNPHDNHPQGGWTAIGMVFDSYDASQLRDGSGKLPTGCARLMRESIARLMHGHRDVPRLSVSHERHAELLAALVWLDDALDTPLIDRLGSIA